MKYYNVFDLIPASMCGIGWRTKVRAKRTKEFRFPRKGEWYLSGAIPEAYQAKSDLTTAYHICTLVKTETITHEIEVK